VSIQNWKDSFPNLLTDNPDPQRYNEEVRQAFELILSILKTAMRNKYRVNITFWGISLTTELHPNLIKQSEELKTSVYKGYKQDKIEMRGDRAEMSDFPLYLNMVAGGLDCRDQAIGGFSFVVKIYALPVVEIIG